MARNVPGIRATSAAAAKNEAASTKKVEGIYDTLKHICRIAKDEDITTAEAADRLAEEILAEGRAKTKPAKSKAKAKSKKA